MTQSKSCTFRYKPCVCGGRASHFRRRQQSWRQFVGAFYNTLCLQWLPQCLSWRVRQWCQPCTGKEVATTTRDRRGVKMKLVIAAGLALTTSLFAIDKEPAKRLGEAAAVLSEVMAAPDKGIPQDVLDKAHCIVIVPSLKTA